MTGRKLRAAREAAAAVPDPELPMVTVADLGILRDVTADGDAVVVTITPTYSGCPALREIARCFLAGAGMTIPGEMARVTGLDRREAGRGNRALVAEGYATMPATGVYHLAHNTIA